MKMGSHTANTALMAAAAGSAVLLAAVASRSLFGASSSEKVPPDLDDIDDEDLHEEESEYITPEDVVKVFDALFLHMQSVLAQLSQQVQQLQMAGQSIPEPQLRKLLKAEFERALVARQATIFEENDVDESCLEEATWEFLGKEEEYPQVKKAVERFQKLYENVSGEKVVGRRPGDDDSTKAALAKSSGAGASDKVLGQEELLKAAEVYFSALTDAMRDVVKSFKSNGEDISDPKVAQKLHMQFASVANDAGEEALEKMGVSMDGFRASIEKHSQSPDVGRVLTMLQMKQQQELMAMGVPAM